MGVKVFFEFIKSAKTADVLHVNHSFSVSWTATPRSFDYNIISMVSRYSPKMRDVEFKVVAKVRVVMGVTFPYAYCHTFNLLLPSNQHPAILPTAFFRVGHFQLAQFILYHALPTSAPPLL